MRLVSKCFILIFPLFFAANVHAEPASCVVNGDDHNCKINVVGFNQEVLLGTQLEYSITGQKDRPHFFNNLPMYFQVTQYSHQENGWSVQGRDMAFRLRLPDNIKGLGDFTDDDRRYLNASLFIQTDKVQALTLNINKNTSAYNRLSAAQEILIQLNKVLRYDYEKSAAGHGEGLPTAENILRAGKGLCFEFSIVFLAAARSVGIPARIVGGNRILPNKMGSHAWVEVKLNDDTWWPLEPQEVGKFLPSVGYFPFGEYRIFEAQSFEEFRDAYSQQRTKDMEWLDGAITFNHVSQ